MTGAGDRPATMAEIARSLVFYLVFYGGSIGYVLAALGALALGKSSLTRVVCAWSRYHRSCMLRLLGIRLEVSGQRPRGKALIALKHESFAEAIDLPALLGDPVVFAKAALLRIPLWGRAAGIYGLVPVERDQGAKALRAMVASARKAVGEGRCLAIFPEGTRVAHGARPPLQAGFAGLYKLLGLPVVPVAIDSGSLYHRRWKRPGTIRVVFGEPIPGGLPREEIEMRVHTAINDLNP